MPGDALEAMERPVLGMLWMLVNALEAMERPMRGDASDAVDALDAMERPARVCSRCCGTP